MSEFTYTPPEQITSYVAYTRDAAEDADDHGQIRPFRSQTFITEFPSIKVKQITSTDHEGRGGRTFTNLRVEFDAASTGAWSSDFGMSLNAADPAAALIQQAYDRGLAVSLVRETVRKAKNESGPIDIHSTIAELRGAKPDNTGADVSRTRDHCINLLAGVGPAGNPGGFTVTGEAVSDPSEWQALRGNKSGGFAPPDWQVADGGLIPRDSTAVAAGGVDVAAIAAAVLEQLLPVLAQQPPAPARPAPAAAFPAGRTPRRQVRNPANVAEGKKWEPQNSDGSVNAGSWLIGKDRSVWAYALKKVLAVGYVDGDVEAAATRLQNILLWIADHVQFQATGRLSRTDASHAESSRWVEVVIDEIALLPAYAEFRFSGEMLDDPDVGKTWARAVVAKAAALQEAAIARTGRYLDPDNADEPAQSPASAGGAEHQTPQQQAAEPTPQPRPAPTNPATNPAGDAAAAAAAAGAQRQRWMDFLGRVVDWAGEHPEKFDPILVDTFGTCDLSTIATDDLNAFIAGWDESDDSRRTFSSKAAAASAAANDRQRQLAAAGAAQ